MTSVLSQLLPRMSGRLLACGLVAAGLSAIVGACSATLDFTECLDDADCAKFFDDGQPMFCDASVCKVRPGGCSSNTQCAGLGEAFICTNSATHLCESTEEAGCEAPIYPSGKVADDVVFVGLMLPKTGADKDLGLAMEKAALAAIEDFNASGALQGGDKIAAVVCDTKSDPTAAVAAAQHLGKTLTVPVLLGPVDDREFVSVAGQVTFAQGVNAFTMGPMVTASMKDLDLSNLLFSPLPGATYQGAATSARLLADFAGDATAKLDLVFSDDAYGLSLYDATATVGAQDPKKVMGWTGEQRLKSYNAVDEAIAFFDANPDPDALILFGHDEVGEILKRYKAGGHAWPTKIYVPQRAMASVVALGDASLAGVVVAIAPDVETAKLAALRTRTGDANLAPEAALAYDAAMSSMLAMAGVAANSPVVGPSVATAAQKLVVKDGVAIDFGQPASKFVPAAIDALKANKGVDIAGFTGTLDFDAKGEVCGPIAASALDASGKKFAKTATYTPTCPSAAGNWADVVP